MKDFVSDLARSINLRSIAVWMIILFAQANLFGVAVGAQALVPDAVPPVNQPQQSSPPPAGIRVRELKVNTPPPLFSSSSTAVRSTPRQQSLELRTEAQMSVEDRAIVANSQPTLRRLTRFNDFDFNSATWSYRQVVCPELPNHLLLQFTRHAGQEDASIFSVAMVRKGAGRMHVLPVERRGFSLFSPAPVNAVTISAFNQIRAEEGATQPPDWLTLGLCYATLAGVHSHAELRAESPREEKFPEAMPATLRIEKDGSASVDFVDTLELPHPMLWSMSFDKTGKLRKATRKPASMISVRPTNQPLVEVGPPTK